MSGASVAISAMLLDIIPLRWAMKLFRERFETHILIERAASRYRSRRAGFEQLDDGIGDTFVSVLQSLVHFTVRSAGVRYIVRETLVPTKSPELQSQIR